MEVYEQWVIYRTSPLGDFSISIYRLRQDEVLVYGTFHELPGERPIVEETIICTNNGGNRRHAAITVIN